MLLSFLMPYFIRFHRYHISDVTIDNTQKGKKKMENRENTWKRFEIKVALSQNCMCLFAMGVDVPDDKNPRKYIDEFLGSILYKNGKYNTEWEFC